MINASAFRQYDIRGKVPQEIPLSEIYTLGRALAAYILQRNPQAKKVIIGRDGRVHSPHLHQELVQAFFDSNFVVEDTGICPTPVVYFAAHRYEYDAALMITASHNGAEYNGIKLCLGKQTLWGSDIQEIHQHYREKNWVTLPQQGCYRRVTIQQDYCAYMAEAFADIKDFPHEIIADCGNGAVGAVLRDVIKSVGLHKVTIVCEEVDGTYPCHPANPVERQNIEHIIPLIQAKNAALGVGFDGDGDRMAAVTVEGDLLAGDHLVALFATDILSRNPGAAIVYDSKCLLGVPLLIKKYQGKPVRSPSGHSIIKKVMREQQALFGGELSCHFFFADEYFGFDDGIYAFLRLIRLLHTHKKSLSELSRIFPHTFYTPEKRIFCDDALKQPIMHQITDIFTRQGSYILSFEDGIRFETQLNGDIVSWGLIRPSHTQPALCIRAESLTQQGLSEIQQMIETTLQAAFQQVAPTEQYSTMKELI